MATSYKAVHTVEVRIWGQTVGAIALEPGKGYYAFEYDPKFRSKNIELAPCLLYTSPSPRDGLLSRMPSSA